MNLDKTRRKKNRMSNIVLKNVCKSYDKEHYAVQDFSA